MKIKIILLYTYILLLSWNSLLFKLDIGLNLEPALADWVKPVMHLSNGAQHGYTLFTVNASQEMGPSPPPHPPQLMRQDTRVSQNVHAKSVCTQGGGGGFRNISKGAVSLRPVVAVCNLSTQDDWGNLFTGMNVMSLQFDLDRQPGSSDHSSHVAVEVDVLWYIKIK